jgi:prolipoprotein diacylglyceryl transferase
VLLATIPPPPVSGLQLGPLDLRLYGVLIALGAYLALRLAVSRYERLGGDPELAERACLVALGTGFVGARLGYVIPRIDRFADDPLSILYIWEGGIVLFGGLLVGTLVTIWYVRSRGGDLPAMMDAIAPALPLAQAIGRWGNYFNQELYGRPTDLPWALEVEPPFRRPGFEDEATFHPTFLYESLWNLVLVAVLLRIDRTGRLRRGALFLVYLIGYGVGRAWIEALRVDTDERYLGLSRNNWIALAVVIGATAALVWWQRRTVTPEADPATAATDRTDADLADPDSGLADPALADPDLADPDDPAHRDTGSTPASDDPVTGGVTGEGDATSTDDAAGRDER